MTQKETIPPKPDKPCFACGSNNWWLRVAYGHPKWICGKCHPKPGAVEDDHFLAEVGMDDYATYLAQEGKK